MSAPAIPTVGISDPRNGRLEARAADHNRVLGTAVRNGGTNAEWVGWAITVNDQHLCIVPSIGQARETLRQLVTEYLLGGAL